VVDIEPESPRLLINICRRPRCMDVSSLAGINMEALAFILRTKRNDLNYNRPELNMALQ
jgi:hypothetical protein